MSEGQMEGEKLSVESRVGESHNRIKIRIRAPCVHCRKGRITGELTEQARSWKFVSGESESGVEPSFSLTRSFVTRCSLQGSSIELPSMISLHHGLE